MCFEYTHNYRFISDTQFARERCFVFKIPKDVHTFEINLFVLFAHLEIFFSISQQTDCTQSDTHININEIQIHIEIERERESERETNNHLWDTRIVY